MADDQTGSALSGAASGAAAGSAAGPWGAVIGGGIGLIGGLLAGGEREKAQKALEKQLALLHSIEEPDYQKMIRQYNLLQAGKEYTPEQLIAEQMARDYMESVQADPELMAKQQQYMQYLQDIAKTGMTPDEAASRNALMRQLEAAQQSKLADIERQAAQTGMTSSGASLLAKLTAQQQAQNAASEEADKLAAQMFQRRMGAQQTLAQQAGSLEQQQYNRALQKAEAKQALDQFNLQQRAKTKEYNVETLNAAQRANLARQRAISDANIALLNKQKDIAAEIEQQKFENKLKKAGYMGGASELASKAAQSRAEDIYGAGKGLGTVVGGLIDIYGNKKQKPKLGFGLNPDDELASSSGQMGSGSIYGRNPIG